MLSEESAEKSLATSPISMSLFAPSEVKVGVPVVVTIEIRNVSTKPVWMVGVLDGSVAGFRYPRYVPKISRDGEPVVHMPSEECGMVAPLRLGDFRLLAIGESFDPTVPINGAKYLPIAAFSSFRPVEPGHYEISLAFSSESTDPNEWLGILEYPGSDEVRARLADVPRVRLDAAVTFTIA